MIEVLELKLNMHLIGGIIVALQLKNGPPHYSPKVNKSNRKWPKKETNSFFRA
jgi:hypothetical protein